MYLVFDCETTGLYEEGQPSPRLVQLAWQLCDRKGGLLRIASHIVQPEGFEIPYASAKIHGISTARAKKEGLLLREVLKQFEASLEEANCLVGHNLEYDLRILKDEHKRLDISSRLSNLPLRDTMKESCKYVALASRKGSSYKFPKLGELYEKLFGSTFSSAHNAAFDVAATAACFFELLRKDVLRPEDNTSSKEIAYEEPSFFKESLLSKSPSSEEKKESSSDKTSSKAKPISTTKVPSKKDTSLSSSKVASSSFSSSVFCTSTRTFSALCCLSHTLCARNCVSCTEA